MLKRVISWLILYTLAKVDAGIANEFVNNENQDWYSC